MGVSESAERPFLKCWGHEIIDQNMEITEVSPEGKDESYFRCVSFGKMKRHSHTEILLCS